MVLLELFFLHIKYICLNENKKLLEDPNESNVISEMVESIREGTSYQSKENIIDELISNYSAKSIGVSAGLSL